MMGENADIYSMVDEYQALLERKDELEALEKENNAALKSKREELAQAMIDAESPRVSRRGFVYSLQDKTKYNRRGGIADEVFFHVLEEHDLGDIIKRTVNAQTLSSAISNLVAENDDELPEDMEEFISSYQYFDISRRKETNRTAARAKKGV